MTRSELIRASLRRQFPPPPARGLRHACGAQRGPRRTRWCSDACADRYLELVSPPCCGARSDFSRRRRVGPVLLRELDGALAGAGLRWADALPQLTRTRLVPDSILSKLQALLDSEKETARSQSCEDTLAKAYREGVIDGLQRALDALVE